ncbi:MAG TPA: ABC transporter ATP-binding protein [Solirubrobacteraceae bacterium]|nr:ABC transporter ATP-binding protein [Solirubrobacteraceae bacterium]
MTATAIEVRGLRVERGGRLVLPELDLDVAAGRITGLVGPSGGGKSTLIRAIVGVQVVAAGSVTVLGEPAGTAALRSRVAYVTQSGSVYRDLTVAENDAYSAGSLGAAGADGKRQTAPGHLTAVTGRRVGNLSGGQQHRVSLACALLGAPELLVLDEPTVGLDPLLRRDLWALFGRLRDEGRTLLVSTHVLDEANNCDAVLLLRDGRILAAETPEALRRDAGTDDLDEAFLRLIEREGPA